MLTRQLQVGSGCQGSGCQGAGEGGQELQRRLIVHGVFGAVEFQGFDRATREFVAFLESSHFQSHEQQAQVSDVQHQTPQHTHKQADRVLLLSGETTLQWTQRFEATGKPYACRLVTNEDHKMASMLRDVLAAKPNAISLRLRDVS